MGKRSLVRPSHCGYAASEVVWAAVAKCGAENQHIFSVSVPPPLWRRACPGARASRGVRGCSKLGHRPTLPPSLLLLLPSLQLKKLEQAIDDCSKAIGLDDTYIKAYLRRAQWSVPPRRIRFSPLPVFWAFLSEVESPGSENGRLAMFLPPMNSTG